MSPSLREVLRVLILAGSSGGLGLGVNALSPRGIPVLSSNGPGAWPERAPRMSTRKLETSREAGRVLAIVDVRSRESFRAGHPLGAFHIPAHAFMEEYSRQGLYSILKASEGVVVLCDSDRCPLGDRVAHQLLELGHRPVYVFEGGWEAFRTSGFQIAAEP